MDQIQRQRPSNWLLSMPRYYRKIIRIRGSDSPNVRYAQAEIASGLSPSNTILVPGVLPYADYQKRLATWDQIRITIGIKAEFYRGKEVLLFPPEWLNRAEEYHLVMLCRSQPAEAIGIDPAEGGDRTVYSAVNRYGLKEQISVLTPDTNVIIGQTIAFMNKHNVIPEKVAFDRGGGGKQHCDRLIAAGYKGMRSIGFGETVGLQPKRGMRMLEEKIDIAAERYAYKNRRAEMYGELRELLDPSAQFYMDTNSKLFANGSASLANRITAFAIPPEYTELRRQLAPMPMWYDEEGRMYLPPKQRKPSEKKTTGETKLTLNALLGCSPDEADSLVLAVHAMLHKNKRAQASVS